MKKITDFLKKSDFFYQNLSGEDDSTNHDRIYIHIKKSKVIK